MTKIAIPSTLPGGLDSVMGQHFGHCEIYTIVEIAEGKIAAVSTMPPCEHRQGGCLAPVMYLHDAGVTTLLAGGMGMRPLMGFQQNGIECYWAGQSETVKDAVERFLAGELPAFSTEYTCGGSH